VFFSLEVPDAYAMGQAMKVVTLLAPTDRGTWSVQVEAHQRRVHRLEAHSEE
jgi:hypothetical protein